MVAGSSYPFAIALLQGRAMAAVVTSLILSRAAIFYRCLTWTRERLCYSISTTRIIPLAPTIIAGPARLLLLRIGCAWRFGLVRRSFTPGRGSFRVVRPGLADPGQLAQR